LGIALHLLPGIDRLRRTYERRWLRTDVLAGITLAAYAVPQVMGYASVAGLPVVAGLWALVAALAVYVAVGSSPQLSVGPESTTALMTAVAIAPLASGDSARYLALAAVLAFIVAVLSVVAWVARLGFLADLLSKPVLVGYMAGVAVLMMVGQLDNLTGVPVEGDSVFSQLRSLAENAGDVDATTVAIAAAVLLFLLLGKRWFPRAPLPLIAVVAAAVVVGLFSLDDEGVEVVGTIPAGLPTPSLAGVSAHDVADLLLPAVGVTLVAFSDNVLTARAFGARTRTTISPNQELLALGTANAASGLVAGFPVSSSGSRTAVLASAGGTTQVCSIVAAIVVAGVAVVGRSALATFPTAALGAIVTFAALQLIDIRAFRHLAAFRRSEALIAVATTAAVVAVDVLYGVLAAVALSIVDLVRRVARPHDGILGYAPGVAGMHDIDDYPDARLVPGLVVYRYDSPLFFANADDFKRRALASLDRSKGPVEWFLLNAEANVELDSTGLDALEELRTELADRGVVFAMARVKQDLRDVLAPSGFIDRVGGDRVFMTLPTAVQAYAAWYRDRHGTPLPGLDEYPGGATRQP
jgi:high affinity sulfate transporter 1